MPMFRDRIKDLRVDNDYTQKKIADVIGIPVSKYSYIERGIQEPSKEVLIALANFYGTSIDYLLGHTYVKEPYPRGFRQS